MGQTLSACILSVKNSFLHDPNELSSFRSGNGIMIIITENHGGIGLVETRKVPKICRLMERIEYIVGHVPCTVSCADDDAAFRQTFHQILASLLELGSQ